MKKLLFYFLNLGIFLLNFSGILMPFNNDQTKSLEYKQINFSPTCSPNYSIRGGGNNKITSISVSSTNGGLNTTFYNPTLPLSFNTGGTVTITVHFAHSGSDGGLRSYQDGVLIGCEDYSPNYLVPIVFPGGGGCSTKFILTISNVPC